MDRTLVILNPAARSERARALYDKIQGLSNRTFIRVTDKPGEARRFAEEAAEAGFGRVVAAGGDGTVNDVVNGIADSDVALGLLPIGTMNVFAAELGIPGNNLQRCWDVIQAGHTREVDLVCANKQYFVQLGGIGLDAQVVKETSWDFKKSFGPLSYVISAAQIAGRKPPRILVETDSGQMEGSFVLVGNGRYYGGPFVLFKDALVDDGKLDVLIFKNLGYLDIIRYLHGILFGTHVNLPDVEYFQTTRLDVSSEQEVPVEVDGEVIGNLPVSFRIADRKLKVLVPSPEAG
jgi:diacylglycerol kinase (ATP)